MAVRGCVTERVRESESGPEMWGFKTSSLHLPTWWWHMEAGWGFFFVRIWFILWQAIILNTKTLHHILSKPKYKYSEGRNICWICINKFIPVLLEHPLNSWSTKIMSTGRIWYKITINIDLLQRHQSWKGLGRSIHPHELLLLTQTSVFIKKTAACGEGCACCPTYRYMETVLTTSSRPWSLKQI